jgi:hypothetical protein
MAGMPPADSGYGSTGSGMGGEQPRSERADDFGASGGRVTGGTYSSAGTDDDGIESSSAPSLPGEDLADKPRLTNDANDLDVQALDDNTRQEDKA